MIIKGAKFNWKCSHCEKRNIETWSCQLDIPKEYEIVVECGKCHEMSVINFDFSIRKVIS